MGTKEISFTQKCNHVWELRKRIVYVWLKSSDVVSFAFVFPGCQPVSQNWAMTAMTQVSHPVKDCGPLPITPRQTRLTGSCPLTYLSELNSTPEFGRRLSSREKSKHPQRIKELSHRGGGKWSRFVRLSRPLSPYSSASSSDFKEG